MDGMKDGIMRQMTLAQQRSAQTAKTSASKRQKAVNFGDFDKYQKASHQVL